MTYKEKLKGFPTIHYPNLIEFADRREYMCQQFFKYGITKTKFLVTDRFDKIKHNYNIIDSADLIAHGHPGNIVSYITLLKDWYDTTSEEYAIFCDDDMDLMSMDYWNFTWEEFVNSLPKDWECIQLVRIEDREYGTDLICGLEQKAELSIRERLWNDWGTAFLAKRSYVKKILERHLVDDNTIRIDVISVEHDYSYFFWPLIENVIFRGLGKVYNFPLFLHSLQFESFSKYLYEHLPDSELKMLAYKNIRSRELYENFWVNNAKNMTLRDMGFL